MPSTHRRMPTTMRPRAFGHLWPGLLSAILLALGASVPSAGAQVPPEGCSLSGYDDRCEVWSAVYDEAGPGGFQAWYLQPHLQANDSLVFVTGQTIRPQDGLDPFLTLAYEQATGDRAWVVRREITLDAEAYANDTALSPAGDALFVAGSESVGPSSQRRNYGLLVAYEAATGKQLWEAEFEDGVGESFEAVALSPDGRSAYAAGRSYPPEGHSNIVVAAFDAATGEERWRETYDGPGGYNDWAVDLAVASDGRRVFLTGVQDQRYDTETEKGDFVTIAYDAEERPGQVLWASTHAGPRGTFDEPAALQLAPDGGLLYVAGTQDLGAGLDSADFATVVYRTDTGERVWSASFDGPAGGSDVAESLAISPEGDRVYMAGVATVERAEALGTRLAVQLDMAAVAYDATTGERDWVSLAELPGDLHVWGRDVAVSPDGRRVYVTGHASAADAGVGLCGCTLNTPVDVVTVALDTSQGSRQWVGRFNSRAGGLASERGGAVVLSPDGRRVFVAGYLNHLTLDPTGERRTAWFGTLSYEA